MQLAKKVPMHPKRILITGSSFSGKTFLTSYFCQRGESACDGEFLQGLTLWVRVDRKSTPETFRRWSNRLGLLFDRLTTGLSSHAYWGSKKGDTGKRFQVVSHPPLKSIDKEWCKHHAYFWDETTLLSFLKEQKKTIYLFGLSQNIFDLGHLFDKAYYLDDTTEILERRFSNNERPESYEWGRTEEQRQIVLQTLPYIKRKAKEKGFIFIGADQSAAEIFHQIRTRETTRPE